MTRLALFAVLFLLNASSLFSQGTFEIRLIGRSTDSLYVQIRATDATYLPTDCNTDPFAISDITFLVRWDTAYNANFGNPNNIANLYLLGDNNCAYGSAFAMTTGTTKSTNGAFHYRMFQLINIPLETKVDWVDDQWNDIVGFKMDGLGSGTGTFEIAPQGWPTSGLGSGTTHPNINVADGSVYPSGQDFTLTINGSASGVSLGSGIVWDGDQNDSNWFNGANWSTGSVPTQYQEASIPGSLSVYPSLSNDVNIKNLTIASGARVSLNGNLLTIRGELSGSGHIRGSATSELLFTGTTASTLLMDQTTPGTTNILDSLTVDNSGGLTIGNAVGIIGILTPTTGTITTGGNLTLQANTPTAYGQINPTGSGTFSGDITVEKALSGMTKGWRYIGLPVVATLDDIEGMWIRTSNHPTANEQNVRYWDADPNGGANAPGWTIPDSTSDNTRGYNIYGNNGGSGVISFDSIWSVTGTVTNGTMNFSIFNSTPVGSGGAFDNGWNLIANPYASNVDVSTLWTTTLNSASYKAIHIYDQLSKQYVAMCSSSVSIITNGGANGTPLSSSVIPPFQAFWVKASSDATISFTNANRTNSATGLGTFMKKEYDLARLDVYTADSAWDQTVIYFDENGNGGLDEALDAFKMFSEEDVPSIYNVSPDGSFSINAINSNYDIHSVSIGYRSSKTGQMSFNLNTTELDAKWFVYLEDKQLGIFYDIKANPYSFNHTQNSDSRFVLHFQTYGLSAEKLVNDIQNMNISGDGSAVYVFVPAFYKDQNYQLEVIDMAGRVVYTDTKLALNHGMNTLNLNLNANAYYAVRIKAAEGIVSGKVQIR